MPEWLLITIIVLASGEPRVQKRTVLFPNEQSCLAEIAERRVERHELPSGVAAVDWKCIERSN